MKRLSKHRRPLVAPWESIHPILGARELPERDVAPPGTDLLADTDTMKTLSIEQL